MPCISKSWSDQSGIARQEHGAPLLGKAINDIGVFVDFCCMPQKSNSGPAREDCVPFVPVAVTYIQGIPGAFACAP